MNDQKTACPDIPDHHTGDRQGTIWYKDIQNYRNSKILAVGYFFYYLCGVKTKTRMKLNRPAQRAMEVAEERRAAARSRTVLLSVLTHVSAAVLGSMIGAVVAIGISAPVPISSSTPTPNTPLVVTTMNGSVYKAYMDDSGMFRDYCDGTVVSNVTYFREIRRK